VGAEFEHTLAGLAFYVHISNNLLIVAHKLEDLKFPESQGIILISNLRKMKIRSANISLASLAE